jgi:hypothetical protein
MEGQAAKFGCSFRDRSVSTVGRKQRLTIGRNVQQFSHNSNARTQS